MNKINIVALILALLVIAMFSGAAISIAYRSVWAILLFLVLGFAFMGFGLTLKRKRQ